MNEVKSALFAMCACLLISFAVSAQPPIKVVFGRIVVKDGALGFMPKRYVSAIDSLDRILKIHPGDTSTLFYRAAFYSLSNSVSVKPYQRDKGVLDDLLIGKRQIDKAISLSMVSLRAKVLRAQLCSDIAYRYTGDESWMFNKQQIANRRADYNAYKDLANQYYDELEQSDKNDASVYERLKVKGNYPIR